MKVFGVTDDGYVAEISHSEVKAVMRPMGDLPFLRLGMVVDLTTPYQHSRGIVNACRSMQEAMRSFEKARSTLQHFADMVITRDAEEKP